MNQKNQRLTEMQIKSVIALYSNGQIQEALDAVETLTKDYPDEPLLYNISGVCYKAIGQLDAAVRSFEKALAIKPDYTEVNYNLGLTFQELDQLDAAVNCYERAIAVNPDHAEAHNNLGVTLKELGQLDAAVRSYERAIAIKPDYAEAYYGFGITLYLLGQLDDAVNCYEKAIAIKPDYAEAHYNLGGTLYQLNQLDDDAVKCYEKAIAIKPDHAEAHFNLGVVLRALGQLDDAVKSYEKAIAIKPDYVEAHHNLSTHKKYIANDPQITQMQSLASTSDLSQSDRMQLSFALAKVYEDIGKQDELFKVLNEGNRLRKEELNYSLDKDQDLFSNYRKLFSSPSLVIEELSSYEASTIRPVFIVGMPRSGTSLVEQIIASHHAVYGAGELNTLANLIFPIVKNQSTNNHSLSEQTFLSIRQQYLDSLSRFNVSENVITDKMPLNFRYIGFILSAFPEAKIVHLKRDAMATCWSIYKNFFKAKGNGWAYNMGDLAGFYELYIDLMAFWHQLYSDKIYDLCYEDLTTNQEEETRKLLEYCELDWDENCLNFHTSKRVVKTSSASQVRQKMYQGSSKAWKKHEAYLQPLIKALSSYGINIS